MTTNEPLQLNDWRWIVGAAVASLGVPVRATEVYRAAFAPEGKIRFPEYACSECGRNTTACATGGKCTNCYYAPSNDETEEEAIEHFVDAKYAERLAEADEMRQYNRDADSRES